MEQCPYELLEVSPRASEGVIQAAFRALIRPYGNPTTEVENERRRRLTEAYQLLQDADRRHRYDQERKVKVGHLIGGTYKVLDQIGEGGFGITYKVEHARSGGLACLKHGLYLSAVSTEVLRNEAKAIWDLRHTSLPSVRDLIEMQDGGLALVTSLVPGKNLEQIIKLRGDTRLDAEDFAWIMERVLNALLYMHYNGVVHGDIKPQNIIVDPMTHDVYLVDFGLSMVKPDRQTTVRGYTEYFAAPEQIANKKLHPRSDFYSLGMTAIYALTGSYERVMRLELPIDVPAPLKEFIKTLICQDPASRPDHHHDGAWKTFLRVRQESFGRIHSNMKPIDGLD